MIKIWLTRTRPAADESAALWRASGFDPIIDPLLEIQPVSHDEISPDSFLIFTSKNGVNHIICRGQRAICVGDATAEHARQAGFSDVVSVDGTSSDVTAWLRANLSVSQAVCHVSGWHVRGSITEDLRAAGYEAQRVKVYRSVPRPHWPKAEGVSRVAFYSPLAAKTFADISPGRDISGLTAICISRATADELSDLQLKTVKIAARPREDALIHAAK